MDTEKQKYTVSVEIVLEYDVVVEAESFNEAAEAAIDQSESTIEPFIVGGVTELVPEKVLNYWGSHIRGVYKQG